MSKARDQQSVEAPILQKLLPAPDPGVKRLAPQFLEPGARVLDLGTGRGRNAIYLAEAGYEVTAADISPVELLRAKQLAALHAVHIAVSLSFKLADICQPDLTDENFDGVFVTRVLQELNQRGQTPTALEATQKLTVPGGYNFVTAYIGSPQDQQDMSHRVILDPDEVATSYQAKGWEIVHALQVIEPLKEQGGKPICRSYDEIVAHKPAAER